MIPLSSSISAENAPFEIRSFLIPRFSSGRLLFLECATRWWMGRGVAFLYCWQRGRQLIWMRMADKRTQMAACSPALEGQWPMKWHGGQWVGLVSQAEFPVFQRRDVPPIHPSCGGTDRWGDTGPLWDFGSPPLSLENHSALTMERAPDVSVWKHGGLIHSALKRAGPYVNQTNKPNLPRAAHMRKCVRANCRVLFK